MKKAPTFSSEQDSWLSRLYCGGGGGGLLLLGKGRDPQIGRKAAGVIRKPESRGSLLNPAAEAPQNYVGPWYWQLWLGFNTRTKAGETAFHNCLTEQTSVELESKFKITNSQVCALTEKEELLPLLVLSSVLTPNSSFLRVSSPFPGNW